MRPTNGGGGGGGGAENSVYRNLPHDVTRVPSRLFAKRYVMESGLIIRVTNFMGLIRFRAQDEPQFEDCIFFLGSYRCKPIHSLCQVFSTGDWVGFAALKLDGGRWTALEVRRRSELVHGYGQLIFESGGVTATPNTAFMRPQVRAEVGGGNLLFHKHTFVLSQHRTFDGLHENNWLRFYAINRPRQSMKINFGIDYTAAALEVEWPLFTGLVVKKTDHETHIWSQKVGLALAGPMELPVGTWVRFSVGQLVPGESRKQWEATEILEIATPPGVVVKIGRYVRVTTPAMAGVIGARYGCVWSELLGRMTVWRWCLKNVDIQPHQNVVVRAFYNMNDERAFDTLGDAWTVYAVKPAAGHKHPGLVVGRCSVVRNVDAVVQRCGDASRKWFAPLSLPVGYCTLTSLRYGAILASHADMVWLASSDEEVEKVPLKPGDRVRTSLTPPSFQHSDEYRAFVVERPLPSGTAVAASNPQQLSSRSCE